MQTAMVRFLDCVRLFLGKMIRTASVIYCKCHRSCSCCPKIKTDLTDSTPHWNSGILSYKVHQAAEEREGAEAFSEVWLKYVASFKVILEQVLSSPLAASSCLRIGDKPVISIWHGQGALSATMTFYIDPLVLPLLLCLLNGNLLPHDAMPHLTIPHFIKLMLLRELFKMSIFETVCGWIIFA